MANPEPPPLAPELRGQISLISVFTVEKPRSEKGKGCPTPETFFANIDAVGELYGWNDAQKTRIARIRCESAAKRFSNMSTELQTTVDNEIFNNQIIELFKDTTPLYIREQKFNNCIMQPDETLQMYADRLIELGMKTLVLTADEGYNTHERTRLDAVMVKQFLKGVAQKIQIGLASRGLETFEENLEAALRMIEVLSLDLPTLIQEERSTRRNPVVRMVTENPNISQFNDRPHGTSCPNFNNYGENRQNFERRNVINQNRGAENGTYGGRDQDLPPSNRGKFVNRGQNRQYDRTGNFMNRGQGLYSTGKIISADKPDNLMNGMNTIGIIIHKINIFPGFVSRI